MMKLMTLAVVLAMAAATSAGAPKIYDPSAKTTPLTGIFQQVPIDAREFGVSGGGVVDFRSSCPVAEPTSGYKIVFSTELGKCYVEGAAAAATDDGVVAANFEVEGQATFNGVVSKCRYSAVGHDWTATLTELNTLRISVDASSVGNGAGAQAYSPGGYVFPSDICSWVIYDDLSGSLPYPGAEGEVLAADLTTYYFRIDTPVRSIGPVKLVQTANGSYVMEGFLLQTDYRPPLYPDNLTVNHSRYYPEANNHVLQNNGEGPDLGSVLWSFKSYLSTFPFEFEGEVGQGQESFGLVSNEIVWKSREVVSRFDAAIDLSHFRFNDKNTLSLAFFDPYSPPKVDYVSLYIKTADVADDQFQTAVIDDSFGGEKQRSDPSTDKRKRRRRKRRRRNRKKWKLGRFTTTPP